MGIKMLTFLLVSRLLLFICYVCPTLRPHGLQRARLLCPPLSPGVCSDSCPLSRWCYLTISSCTAPFSSHPQSFPAAESVLPIRWPKYWSFSISISPSNEYSGLISFRMDCLDLCSPWDFQGYFPTSQCKNINSLSLSFLYNPTLTSIQDYWKNHSFD